MSSLLYHLHPPTIVTDYVGETNVEPKIAVGKNMKMRSLQGFEAEPKDDYLESRVPVLVNSDCHIVLAAPKKSLTEYFYKNAQADEVIFIHKGKGTLRTQLGNIAFGYGDYLVVPRGIIYQIDFDTEDNRLVQKYFLI